MSRTSRHNSESVQPRQRGGLPPTAWAFVSRPKRWVTLVIRGLSSAARVVGVPERREARARLPSRARPALEGRQRAAEADADQRPPVAGGRDHLTEPRRRPRERRRSREIDAERGQGPLAGHVRQRFGTARAHERPDGSAGQDRQRAELRRRHTASGVGTVTVSEGDGALGSVGAQGFACAPEPVGAT
jgi:hypothetical protein